MKKIAVFVLMMFCAGCVIVQIPKYLNDDYPYRKKFYVDFDRAFEAAKKAITDAGWRISDTSHPAVFDRRLSQNDKAGKQVVIFTEVRQTPLFLSSRYLSINVYLAEEQDGTSIEIRAISVTPLLFKSAQSYKNDALADGLFARIGEILKK